jgi:hypothetical protein
MGFLQQLEAAAIMVPLANSVLSPNLPTQENTAINNPLYSQTQDQKPDSCSLEQSQEKQQQEPNLALRDQVNETGLPDDWAKDKENSQKTANEADTAGLAQDQAVASGSPDPNSSTQENTSPTAQTQQKSNADLASQLGDSSKSKTDSVTEADEVSDTIA